MQRKIQKKNHEMTFNKSNLLESKYEANQKSQQRYLITSKDMIYHQISTLLSFNIA